MGPKLQRVNIHTVDAVVRTDLDDDGLTDLLERVAQERGIVTVDVAARPLEAATRVHVRVQAITRVEVVVEDKA